ncbi:MAG: DUF58 domain-containing protein [Myxococcota bacterium]
MEASRDPVPNVYVDLHELAALKHAGQSFAFLPRQPVTSLLSGRRASRLRGRGLSFEEMRLYQPGDDPRTIDWKATARTRETHVRVYTEERERPAVLVVDQRLSMFFGSRGALKSVAAVRAAALSAWRVVGVGDRVGAIVFDDSRIVDHKPQRSDRNVLRILGTLTEFNHRLSADSGASPNPQALNQALERARRFATHDYLVVIISDFDGADPTTRKLVTELRRHNDVIAIRVWDPLEAELPDLGRVVVSDGDKQIDADTADASLRNRYREHHRQVVTQMDQISLQYDVPSMTLWTDRDVLLQIRDRLGRVPGTRRG